MKGLEQVEVDLAIIGGGSAGLSVAAGAAQLGARTLLFEAHRMGGECLYTGCVPSKSLIAAAAAAQAMRTAARFGFEGHAPSLDPPGLRAHLATVIGGIAPHDSVERFQGLGVRVVGERASFKGPQQLASENVTVHARRIVVATGSRPAIPPIPGLAEAPYLTNETIFDLADWPAHLVVIGGGPIGTELAQAFRRLGAEVTLLERERLLPKDDPDAVAVVRAALLADGVALHEGAEVRLVESAGKELAVVIGDGAGGERRLVASHLLVATGRRPRVEGLGLELAGIDHDERGIAVDHRMRTSNRRVFAIGDVTGRLQFTHMASHQASVVIRNALFHLPAKIEERAVPWVTYADPELAQVGPTEAQARADGTAVTIARASFADNDRARTELATEGFVKLVIDRRGRPLGATIVGRHAGELIQLWTLAIRERIRLSRVADLIAPYPTLGEAGKRAAGNWFAPRLFSERTRRLVRFLQRF